MDLFAVDFDCESYSGTSDSEDQEECEFTYSDHAKNILSSLDESIDKIDNFLTFERGFLHGDIVCPVSDPSGQLGRVVGVAMLVDLETSSGDIIKDVNSKKLSRVRSFVSGDCVVMGPWIGRVIRAFDLVTVMFSDGAKCELLLRDSEVLKPIPPILFEDAPYFYYPGQRVRVIHPSVFESATWLCGSWRPNRDEGVVSHVDVGLVHVNWITSVTNVWGDRSSNPRNYQNPKDLSLLSCFPYANWQLGDWCALTADVAGMNSSKQRAPLMFYGKMEVYLLPMEPQTLVPVSTLGDHDFWPGQFVLENLTVQDAAECQRTGTVRDMDALQRTVNVKWTVPADTYAVRSAMNIARAEAGLTNGPIASREKLVTSSDFLSCIGNVLGYKDDGIEVQWASGVISKVQPFEIIGLDRLLDNSSELMNEDHTAGDLVDMSDQEGMHHDSTNVVADPRYEIVRMAELQPSAKELSEEKEILESVVQVEKPNHSSEDDVLKQFDMVTDSSDHHFVKENGYKNVTRAWVKKVQQEWAILQKDLPGVIFVVLQLLTKTLLCLRGRLDLLRACIVGAEGTPYHDNLFFFDIFFPPDYPHEPPSVHYHSGGLRLNPNLYESGKALVLNEKPYFNEAGYDKFVGKADGEKNSITYNENAFLLSCKSMMYVLHKPPKHFEKFVKEHFASRAPRILDACEAYLGGDLVGHARDNAYISEDGSKNCSTGFKIMLGKLLPKLVSTFTNAGIVGT
ncbi:hypothetical protein PR202_gb02076 [Eleusine coracana subsp. coracana]|uniref:UBC core domain-containing protein n=1 Tax=Eleusine coracana subsp. coracana TaxID=191504 RepID=A0AAV5DXK0_ELECO|nr:hypothetical protein PR202_gb02076 [Eleusine coracana subsp. coracana]